MLGICVWDASVQRLFWEHIRLNTLNETLYVYGMLVVGCMCMGCICIKAILVAYIAMYIKYVACVCETRCWVYVYGMHLSNGSCGSIKGSLSTCYCIYTRF